MESNPDTVAASNSGSIGQQKASILKTSSVFTPTVIKSEERSSSQKDIEELKSEPSERTGSKYETRRISRQTCVRSGTKICYTELDDIVVRSKVADKSEAAESTEGDRPDSVHSGESLFKDFSFDQCVNDIETQKCIAFWKNVMERNLTPVKCTLITNTVSSSKEAIATKSRKKYSRKKAAKKPTEDGKEAEVPLDETKPSAPSGGIDQKVLMDVFDELKKRNLDKLTLMIKKNCKTCELEDTLDKNLQYSDEVSNTAEEVKALSKWKVKPHDESKGPVQPYKPKKKPSSPTIDLEKRGEHTSSKQKRSSLGSKDKERKPSMRASKISKTKKAVSPDKDKPERSIISDQSSGEKVSVEIPPPPPIEIKKPRGTPCCCKSEICTCKHDLMSVLKSSGQRPCTCGFTECTCRANYYVPQRERWSPETEQIETLSDPQIVTTEAAKGQVQRQTSESEVKPSSRNEPEAATSIVEQPKTSKTEVSKSQVKPAKSGDGSKRSRTGTSREKLEISSLALTVSKGKPKDELGKDLKTIWQKDEDKTRQAASHLEVEADTTTKGAPMKPASTIMKTRSDSDMKATTKSGNAHIQYGVSDTSPEAAGFNLPDFSDDVELATLQDRCSQDAAFGTGRKCPCGFDDCDCELQKIEPRQKPTGPPKKCVCSCGQMNCTCSFEQRIRDKINKMEKARRKKQREKEMTQCKCGFPDCDCNDGQSKTAGKSEIGILLAEAIKTCKCDHIDCDCDKIAEEEDRPRTFSTGSMTKFQIDQLIALSEKRQEAEKEYKARATQCSNLNFEKVREYKYCYICGHYDCPCEIKRIVQAP